MKTGLLIILGIILPVSLGFLLVFSARDVLITLPIPSNKNAINAHPTDIPKIPGCINVHFKDTATKAQVKILLNSLATIKDSVDDKVSEEGFLISEKYTDVSTVNSWKQLFTNLSN
jgi:hypothetical protein